MARVMPKASRILICAVATGVALLAVSVYSFGPSPAAAATVEVTCNNTTTDDETLNAAISASAIGDELVIDGPCLINGTVKLLGDRAYRGESRSGTIIKQADGANLTAMFASDSWVNNSSFTGNPVSVRHLKLDGNKVGNSAATDGLVIRSWLTTVEDIHIIRTGGSALKITNLSANGTALTNSQVNGRVAASFFESADLHGVFVQDTGNSVTDWVLEDNWVASPGKDAIHLDNSAGWMVERNHVYDVPENGIYAARLYGSTVADNYIEDFGKSATGGIWYGVFGSLQGSVASTLTSNRIFNIAGEPNVSSTYRYLGITVPSGTGAAAVTGNAIRGANTPRGTGLYYSMGSGTGLRVSSTGNSVVDVATPRTIGAGVTLDAGL